MLAYQRLPGALKQRGLNGITDWFGMPSFVQDYWNVVKQNIQNIRDTGPKITAYWIRITAAQRTLVARGNTAAANALADELLKIADDMQKWSKVNQYLDDYLPTWMGLDDPNTNVTTPGSAVSGLGFVPLILSAVAIAALAYVVNTGMALYQDYQYKNTITQAVIEQKMTSGQAKDILSVPKSEGLLEKTIDTVGVTAAIGIPTALLVGGGIYLLVMTGGLKSILSMFSSVGGSSSESGG